MINRQQLISSILLLWTLVPISPHKLICQWITLHSYLPGIHNNNFVFKNINEEIPLPIIDKVAPKSSCGFDGISSKMIKIIKTALIKPK